MVLKLMSRTGNPLSALVGERAKLFSESGEINRKLKDPIKAVAGVESFYAPSQPKINRTDG